MPMKRCSFFTATMLLAGSEIFAVAQTTTGGFTVTVPASSTASAADAGMRAHTNIRTLATPAVFSGKPQFYGPPFPGLFYEDPASIACIYGLSEAPSADGCNPNLLPPRNPTGGSKAIAIVDAYDYPNAFADLQAFSAQFGVAAVTSSSFQVKYAPSGTACTGLPVAAPPPVDPTGGWEIEEALDIEWSHSMAPGAALYLVEAQSNSFADLACAVIVASGLVKKAGGGEISMSWGGGEFPQETQLDSLFTTPGIVYFASAGDSPGTIWPSTSPNVVSVGGTTLSRDPVTGSFINENVWQDGGSGPSFVEPRPSYQDSIKSIVGNSRGTPDIALVANPYTGVWVLDNFAAPPGGCGGPCWYIVGGTSVSSPTVAGIVNAEGSFASSTAAELTSLYKAPRSNFNDITLGSCGPYLGYFATSGWDFCSGLGSPKGHKDQ